MTVSWVSASLTTSKLVGCNKIEICASVCVFLFNFYCLRNTDDIYSPFTQDGGTALLYAGWKGHSEIVKLLLRAGAREIPDNVCEPTDKST